VGIADTVTWPKLLESPSEFCTPLFGSGGTSTAANNGNPNYWSHQKDNAPPNNTAEFKYLYDICANLIDKIKAKYPSSPYAGVWRVGTHDSWATKLVMDTWINNSARLKATVMNILDAAACASADKSYNLYVIFTVGGHSNPGEYGKCTYCQDIFDENSLNYERHSKCCAAIADWGYGHAAMGGVEVYNEADYTDSFTTIWGETYKDASFNKLCSWTYNKVADVRSKMTSTTTAGSRVPLSVGTTPGQYTSIFWQDEDDYTSSNYKTSSRIYKLFENCDFLNGHPYLGMNSTGGDYTTKCGQVVNGVQKWPTWDCWVDKVKAYQNISVVSGKPTFLGEVGDIDYAGIYESRQDGELKARSHLSFAWMIRWWASTSYTEQTPAVAQGDCSGGGGGGGSNVIINLTPRSAVVGTELYVDGQIMDPTNTFAVCNTTLHYTFTSPNGALETGNITTGPTGSTCGKFSVHTYASVTGNWKLKIEFPAGGNYLSTEKTITINVASSGVSCTPNAPNTNSPYINCGDGTGHYSEICNPQGTGWVTNPATCPVAGNQVVIHGTAPTSVDVNTEWVLNGYVMDPTDKFAVCYQEFDYTFTDPKGVSTTTSSRTEGWGQDGSNCGKFTIRKTPTIAGTWTLTITIRADGTYTTPSTKTVNFAAVGQTAKPNVFIELAATSTYEVGQPITVSGRIWNDTAKTYAVCNSTLTITWTESDGVPHISTLVTGPTGSNCGAFTTSYIPTIAGQVTLKVVFPEDSTYAASQNSTGYSVADAGPACSIGAYVCVNGDTACYAGGNYVRLTWVDCPTALTVNTTANYKAKFETSIDNVSWSAASGKTLVYYFASQTGGQSYEAECVTAADGTCQISFTPLAAGTWQVYAYWNTNSTKVTPTQVVTANAASLQTTTLALANSPTSVTQGSATTVTATLTHVADGTPKATGAITFTITAPDGTTQTMSCTTDATGTCSVSLTCQQAGTYTIKADYAGDATHAPSTKTITMVSSSVPTTVYTYTVTPSGSNYLVKDSNGAQKYSSTAAHTAVNWAINNLGTRTAMKYVLMKGTFPITGQITLQNYTGLHLDGKANISSTSTMHMVYASSKHDLEVSGGEWNRSGGSRTYTDSNTPIAFDNCYNGAITNLYVHDSPNDNIYAIGCQNFYLSKVDSRNAGYMLCEMSFSRDCTIEDGNFYNGQCGIYCYTETDGVVQNVSGNIIRRCTVGMTNQSGISISLRGSEDVGDNCLFEYNVLTDCGNDGDHPAINMGFGSNSTKNSIIRYNTISDPKGLAGAGIELSGINCQVIGNDISKTGEGGINAYYGSGNTITGNTIDSCGSQGYASLILACSNSVATGNTIKNCKRAAISNTGSGNTVTPNTIINCTGTGSSPTGGDYQVFRRAS